MHTNNHIFTVLTVLFLLTGVQATAQEEGGDTTRVSLGDMKVIIIDGDDRQDSSFVNIENMVDEDYDGGDDALTHWGGVDLGVNFLMNANNDMNFEGEDAWLDLNHARSLNWSINAFEKKIKIIGNYAGIVTGLGVGWSSYTFRDSVRLQASTVVDGQTIEGISAAYDSSVSYTKNKLRVTQLKIPVLLEFNTSKDADRSFHLSGGVVGNWNFSNVYKRKYEVDGDAHKDRTKGNYHVRDLSADAMVRVGYGNLTLFAQYGLLSLFEENKGPEVYPLTMGVAISNW